jgi:Flp pilus assembly protein TadG
MILLNAIDALIYFCIGAAKAFGAIAMTYAILYFAWRLLKFGWNVIKRFPWQSAISVVAIAVSACVLTGCGNDPVTYAGYFDEDQDKSVTTNNSSNGDQVFNNYGSGNMNVTNNTGDTYIQYDKSIENTINSLSFSYTPGYPAGTLYVTNLSADTVWLTGSFLNNNGYVNSFHPLGHITAIPPFGDWSVWDASGGKCATVTRVSFFKREIDRSQSCCPSTKYIPASIWTGAITLGNCK